MNFSSCRRFSQYQSRRGFALLVTVVLVAFVVLLLVGLATFTRVETQVADNSQQQAKARQHALAALNLAIGQLQRHAGPDQRVTATSEIISTGASPLPSDHITGVWSTTAALGSTPEVWLVSGTHVDPTDISSILVPTSISPPVPFQDDQIFLVYQGTVSAAADHILLRRQPLRVPLSQVPGLSGVGNATIGHYAYWVGDEGVKASVSSAGIDTSGLNFTNPSVGGDDWTGIGAANKRDRLQQLSHPRTFAETALGLDYTQLATVSDLRKVLDLPQLQFVGGGPPLALVRDHFHDFTPLARGVLSRTFVPVGVTHRGLRLDLSSDIEAPSATTTALNDYLATRPSSEIGFNAIYDIASRKPAAVGSRLEHVVSPVLSEAGVKLAFELNGARNASLSYAIVAELWNPYAASLRLTGTGNLRIVVRKVNGPVTYSLTDNAATPEVHTITIPDDEIVAISEFETPINLLPGEVRQFVTNLPNGNLNDPLTGAAVPLPTTFVSASTVNLPATALTTFSVPALGSGPSLPDSSAWEFELQENVNGGWQRVQHHRFGRYILVNNAPVTTPYSVGYGFELNRNLGRFTEYRPGASVARDPRGEGGAFTVDQYQVQQTTGIQPAGHYSRNSRAASNVAVSNLDGDGPLEEASEIPVILFDLPRQEVTSLAQLRHMVGRFPYEVTSSEGSGTKPDTASDRQFFDGYFLSTIPQSGMWDHLTQGRPNPSFELYFPPQAPAGEFDSAAVQLTSLRNGNTSARYQLLRGAFNVNSTSVNAWRAMLGIAINGWQTAGDFGDIENAFFRVPHGAQELSVVNLVPPGGITRPNSLSAVGRRLSDAELTDLAQRIVGGIKNMTVPNKLFSSLDRFWIDGSSILRNAIIAANYNQSLVTSPTEYRDLSHSAGGLSPHDVISAIAPLMSVRSDTFRIRAYGDVFNPVTQSTGARVWCEAIVQRVPDLAEAPDADVADVMTADPSSYPFGRRFLIISFRWLSPSDI